jgi:hypothetical protein
METVNNQRLMQRIYNHKADAGLTGKWNTKKKERSLFSIHGHRQFGQLTGNSPGIPGRSSMLQSHP